MPDEAPAPSTPTALSAVSPETCGQCRFWEHKRESDGFCKRYAPVPGSRENEIARWRQTRALDWCGEGEVAKPEVTPILCSACRFWHRPGHGIEPLLYGDRFHGWWERAGLCRRYAPQANAELGGRSFWPATHDDDSCADGRSATHESRQRSQPNLSNN